jgi:C4-dicarboxylate transporter DctQ subunit
MGIFLNGWNKTEKYIVGLLGLITIFLAFINTILRYVFNYSPEWMEEIIVYLIIWAAFFITGLLVEERRHVGATFFVELLPPKAHRVVEIITSSLALIFCIIVLFYGYQIVHITYTTDARSLTGMRYPLWIFYLALPVGLTLMTARFIRRIYRLIFRFDLSELRDSHEMSRSKYKETLNDQRQDKGGETR